MSLMIDEYAIYQNLLRMNFETAIRRDRRTKLLALRLVWTGRI